MNSNPLIIIYAVSTMILGMVLESLELLWGSWAFLAPSWVFVFLLFWSSYYPSIFGVGMAWVLGLLMDAWLSTPLGQHALLFLLANFFISFAYDSFKELNIISQCVIVGVMTLIYKLFILLLAFDAGVLLTQSVFVYIWAVLSSAILWSLLSLTQLRSVRKI